MPLRAFLLPVLAVVLAVSAATPARAEAPAHVTVVHGVPGLVVDVYVNGAKTLPAFAPRTITDPLALPPGTYDIGIVPEGQPPAPALLSTTVTLAGGEDVTLVAHLSPGGPALTAFENDLADAGRGEGRLIVRHVADAPAVDARLERRIFRWSWTVGVLADLSSGEQAQADVHAGRYQARLTPAGSRATAFGPVPLTISEGRATIVYAIGDLAGGSFDLLAETRDLSAPDAAVTVVHGVPGLVVDVYVNGALALPAFAPGTITDPLALPPGTYDLAIVPQGGDPGMPAIQGTVTLAGGDDATLVAHLDAGGAPVLSAFGNDVSRPGLGQSRLVVRHVAAAPAVDLPLERFVLWRFFRLAVFRGLENGGELSRDLLSGLHRARLNAAGTTTTVLGPAELLLSPGWSYTLYAIGSLGGGLELLVQVRDLR
jgi:hypothetical protein